jgi:hypothetical protein
VAAVKNHRDPRTVQLARLRYRVTDEPEISPENAEREAALREEYSPRPLRRPQYYRRPHRRDEYDDYEIRRDFERESKRHRKPGHDEQEDRWLDRF